jgi:beta-galactosidase
VLVRSEQRFAPEPSGAGLTVQTVHTIHGSGHVSVEAVVVPDTSLPTLPRIGMRCGVRTGLKHLRWYGRGPHESYPDRKHGALFGIHQSTVEEQFFPFVDPCECGGHTDTRWMELFDEEGTALRVQGQPEFHFSALPYTQEELIRAGHVYELERAGDTILCIDGFHMGLGGDTGWSLNVHPEYLLPADRTYRYGFALVL